MAQSGLSLALTKKNTVMALLHVYAAAMIFFEQQPNLTQEQVGQVFMSQWQKTRLQNTRTVHFS